MSSSKKSLFTFVKTPERHLDSAVTNSNEQRENTANSEQDDRSVGDIEKLVVSLIEEKRTVVVAVMDATQSTVHQKIFKFAGDVDTNGERTIGVLTKSDLVSTTDTDAFEAVLRRARNQERVLNHGWYIVKNRSSSETKANVSLEAARTKESALFSCQVWHPNSSGISRERMGIASLRIGLSNVFCTHIRSEFPVFNEQTRALLEERKERLQRLGHARTTVSEQRQYLNTIVSTYQKPKQMCLYEDFRSRPKAFKLALVRILAQEKKEMLRDRLKSAGAVYIFQTPTNELDLISDSACEACTEKTTNIYTWINYRYQSTKSCALPGIVPYNLVERLFEEQTKNWTHITDDFVDRVENSFIEAVERSLEYACPNIVILDLLKKLVCSAVKKKMGNFKSLCHTRFESERTGLQMVAGEEHFLKDIRQARTLRFMSAVARLEYQSEFPNTKTSISGRPCSLTPEFNFSNQGSTTSTASNTTKADAPTPSYKTFQSLLKSNEAKFNEVITHKRQMIYEIHDILKAYYNLAVQHYTDTICKIELNQNFIGDIMDTFSTEFLDSLPGSEISRIAAESPADRKTRRELKEDIERLEMAILREPLEFGVPKT